MTSRGKGTRRWSLWMMLSAFALVFATVVMADTSPIDPGPRAGNAGAGGPMAGLTVKEAKFFDVGLDEFEEVQSVTGSIPDTEEGLGPRFNSNSCVSCHAHPATGGSSPPTNPQVIIGPPNEVLTLTGLGIIKVNGPVREVRFKSDGGVHDLFTITGLEGTPAACNIRQPPFDQNRDDLRFRIPTPLFGLGLIEAIEDATILLNEGPKSFGINGIANRNGNDGTVTRFGWKAQNKSLVIFSGEAYNVEQGVTNELFPDERGEGGVPDPAACRTVRPAPQDSVNYELTNPQRVIDNVSAFANFMRFLAPPVQVTSYRVGNKLIAQEIADGETAFNKAGCSICHMKMMKTGSHVTTALANKPVNLFSDLLLHDIGTGDEIPQGGAKGNQFRTAPLWGVGQRLFFLHDGSAENLLEAISAHGGEAAPVKDNFNGLSTTERQNLLYFLRSL